MHEDVTLTAGISGQLKHALIHHSYPTLSDYIDHMNRYSSLGAEMLAEKGYRGFSLIDIVLRPLLTFVYNYFLRLGFLDGREGLLLHLYHAVYVSWKYAKGVGVVERQAANPRRKESKRTDIGSACSCPVRDWAFRYRQYRTHTICIADIEQHPFGNDSAHFSRLEIDHEQSLSPFDFSRIGTLLFHPGDNFALPVAETDSELDQLVGVRDIGNRKNGADADIYLIQHVDGNEWLERCRRHQTKINHRGH